MASQRRSLREFVVTTAAAALLTFVAFQPSLPAAFVSDDLNAIVENEWVAGPFDPIGIVRNFSWWGQGRSDSQGYRPAATISFALSRMVSGADPSGWRAVNFAMHALASGLVFSLARAIGVALAPSFAAAMLFAALPIHSEAVIWIVGRAELGAALAFLFAALVCLRVQEGAPPWMLAPAALALCTGMLFKENAVTVLAAPLLFQLLLPSRREDGQRRAMAATAALAAGAGMALLLRAAADGAPMKLESRSLLDNPLSVVGTGTRLLGSIAVLGRYLALTFWPASLSIDYSYDGLGLGEGFVANGDSAVALVFAAGCALLLWRCREARSRIAAGLLLAAASYSIVSNTVLVLGTILGERLFYLPTAGLCIAAAAAAEPLLPEQASQRRRFWIGAAAFAVPILASIVVDRSRSLDWRTPQSLFAAAVRVVPDSARAQMELASALGAQGRIDESIEHFDKALEILPDYAAAAYNRGNMYARASRLPEAEASYRRAIELQPRLVRAWHNLSLVAQMRGDTAAQIEALRGALAAAPSSPDLENELGEALLRAGRYDEALAVYDPLAARGEATAITWFNRGVARHHLGGCAAAIDDYRKAAASAGAPPQVFSAAAGCMRELGHSEEAAALERAGKVANRDTRR